MRRAPFHISQLRLSSICIAATPADAIYPLHPVSRNDEK